MEKRRKVIVCVKTQVLRVLELDGRGATFKWLKGVFTFTPDVMKARVIIDHLALDRASSKPKVSRCVRSKHFFKKIPSYFFF